jgi:hypothetical protein
MPWTVYCHVHTDSGRRYIGLTSQSMLHRWNQHVSKSKSSKDGRWHFPNAIRKFGKDAFSHEILEVCETLEAANEAEAKWIDHFDSRNPEKGFNLARGGEHIPHQIRKNPWDDPEYRKKAIIALHRSLAKPEVIANRSTASKKAWDNYERRKKAGLISKEVQSRPEVLEKNRSSQLGKKHSQEHRAKTILALKNRSPELIKRIASMSRGRKFSQESREKIKIKSLGRKQTLEARMKISLANKGKTPHPTALANSLINRVKRAQTRINVICSVHGSVILEEQYRTKTSSLRCKICAHIPKKFRYLRKILRENESARSWFIDQINADNVTRELTLIKCHELVKLYGLGI